METQKICPNCRKPLPADVPLGLCPECLIKAGFPTGTAPGASAEAVAARFVPPPVAEIAALFPQLEIIRLIGQGGMGAVYKARQPSLERFVALKVLPPAAASDPGFAERFNREARALARLSHPNIVAVHDFGKAGPLHYLLMEFVDGTNLREVERSGELTREQALAIVPQICEALQFAHNEGIVHRDIKPENLLLDKKGRLKITDFGIAKMVGVGPGQQMLTGAKDVVGTPHYMAPEQIERPRAVDHRADIYSLGVVFYEMLTGELPLGKFAPPSRKVEVDVRLDEIVLRALEKEPERRYQQASQVKTDVETITGTQASASKPLIAAQPFSTQNPAVSDKAILPAFLLAFFFGLFGAHRFYVGKIWSGSSQLGAFAAFVLLIIACANGSPQPASGILLGFVIFGCLIWATADWILIACRAFRDGQGRRMTRWLHPQPGETKTAHESAGTPPVSAAMSEPATVRQDAQAPEAGAPPAGQVPPSPPSATGNIFSAKNGLIVAPAVALMVAAIWKLFSALMASFFLAGMFTNSWLGNLRDIGIGSYSNWGVMAGFSILLFKVIPALFILVGALQMLRLRSYAWSVAAGILSIVACSLVGLPIGIWALIILSRQDVKDRFADAACRRESRTIVWPWALGAVLLVLLLGLIAFTVSSIAGHSNVTVSGIVTDAASGKGITGARVDDNRYGADTDKPPAQAWTDGNGHYELNTSYEEHTIAASAPGYETRLSLLRTRPFGAARNVRMNFELKPLDPAPTSAALTNRWQYPSNESNSASPPPQAPLFSNAVAVPAPSAAPAAQAAPATPIAPSPPEPPPAGNVQSSSPPKPAAVARRASPNVEKIYGPLTTSDPFQQDFSRTLSLSPGGCLRLDNVNGRIEIAGWDKNEVSIKALKHGKTQKSIDAVKIEVNSSPDEIAVHTDQPSSHTGFSPGWLWFKSNERNDATVDYAVHVPQNAVLKSISSVNGNIVIEDMLGDIQASTVNGKAQVNGAAGNLKLSSVNGRIEAKLASLDKGQSVSLSTVNGHIEVTLSANANARVSASTVNGGMSSDFPELIVKKEFPVGCDLNGSLGNASATVNASSVNGRINVRRSAND